MRTGSEGKIYLAQLVRVDVPVPKDPGFEPDVRGFEQAHFTLIARPESRPLDHCAGASGPELFPPLRPEPAASDAASSKYDGG